MIGDMFNNNKRREVCTREGQRMYMGKKYAREESTGYYVCTSGKRRRLHVVMYEQEILKPRGIAEIPSGMVVHHKDFNKNNNTIGNLCCIFNWEHEKIHNHKKGEKVGKILDFFTGEVVYCD